MPTCPVFTRAKIKSRFGILKNLPSHYVEVLREFRKRFIGKRPVLFKSGQWHFHEDNTPVHNTILVTDYLSIETISAQFDVSVGTTHNYSRGTENTEGLREVYLKGAHPCHRLFEQDGL